MSLATGRTSLERTHTPLQRGLSPRRIASLLYPRYIKLFEVLNQNALLNAWIAEHGAAPHFPERLALYDHLIHAYLQGAPIDYLEFGVYRGESILWWAAANPHPDSRFFGFDSFEGLPEGWALGMGGLERGALSTDGEVPATDDPRVRFVKGWYQETLPEFLQRFRPQARIVLHCDSDIYGSTLYPLASLDRLLRPGSVVMFDEFNNHEEFRAFNDYVRAFNRRYRALGTARSNYKNAAIELL